MPRKTSPGRGRAAGGQLASMRPRPDAAENLPGGGPRAAAGRTRFNEAAARCRGKPVLPQGRRDRDGLASMRPRPDAAENPRR